jgi:hypothetical protein
MIAAIIVGGSLVMAAAFLVLWWRRPPLRRGIEAPGEGFVANVRRYDESCRNAADRGRMGADGSD